MSNKYIIGISGGTGAGKTTFAKALLNRIGTEKAVLIPHDAYYKDLSHLPQSERELQNFDHPSAYEDDLLVRHLQRLYAGKSIQMPIYDFAKHTRQPEAVLMTTRTVIILEGILILANSKLRDLMNLKIFVEEAADMRLLRRMRRDIAERGRTYQSVAKQYLTTVRPMHEQYVDPSSQYADMVIPGTGDFTKVIDLIIPSLPQ